MNYITRPLIIIIIVSAELSNVAPSHFRHEDDDLRHGGSDDDEQRRERVVECNAILKHERHDDAHRTEQHHVVDADADQLRVVQFRDLHLRTKTRVTFEYSHMLTVHVALRRDYHN